MEITFHPLSEDYFPLLLKWLESPHVKTWWDPDIQWTPKLIQEKYGSYTKGYKLVEGEPKEIHGFIIHADAIPVGYIQLYDAHDFPKVVSLGGLPQSMAAIDILIGEKAYLGKKLGSFAVALFLKQFCEGRYETVLVDPETQNRVAVRMYERAGFMKIRDFPEHGKTRMLKTF